MNMQEPPTSTYPWTKDPLIVSAPMRQITLSSLAIVVSRAGGLGFLAAGYDLSNLLDELELVKSSFAATPLPGASDGILPIGVGFINWGADLQLAVRAIEKYVPAAVWFFAPEKNKNLVQWAVEIRKATGRKTKIWVQVGTVSDALEVAEYCHPDILVIQGADAGGHGLNRGASLLSLVPEVADALNGAGHVDVLLIAAGGIADERGVAACLCLGASGVAMGTTFLASEEACIAKGYQDDVLTSSDGGVTTVRTDVYDTLRGTLGWPSVYGGRGIINESFLDAKDGKVTEENKKLYADALKKGDEGWGKHGRLTAYAGTGVGLVRRVRGAGEIVVDVRDSARRRLQSEACL